MPVFDLKKYFADLNNGNLMFIYKGNITLDIIYSLPRVIEQVMTAAEETSNVQKMLYTINIQSLQYMYHNAIPIPKGIGELMVKRFGIIAIYKMCGYYKILTANFVKCDMITFIKDTIEWVNISDEAPSNANRQEIFRKSNFTPNINSAKILLNIQRNTKSKFTYSFSNVDDEHFLFTLETNFKVL